MTLKNHQKYQYKNLSNFFIVIFRSNPIFFVPLHTQKMGQFMKVSEHNTFIFSFVANFSAPMVFPWGDVHPFAPRI
jgi:hypothetical protein